MWQTWLILELSRQSCENRGRSALRNALEHETEEELLCKP